MNLFKFYKRNKLYKGGIEVVTPSQIIGWLYSKDNLFNKVALICNKEIISEASIKEERNDLSNALNLNNKYIGFKLNIPSGLKSYTGNLNRLSVVAINKKSSKKIKLDFLGKESVDFKLRYLINNGDLLGKRGHIDGILDDGFIHGWCAKKKDRNPQKIWLRCVQKEEPIPIICDSFREDIGKLGFNAYSGFEFSSIDIPDSFRNKLLRFTFDKEGFFYIPQTKDIIVSETTNHTEIMHIDEANLISSTKDIDYLKFLNDPNSKFINNWEQIYQYKLFLDTLETNINKEKPNFLSKMKLFLFKKN